MWDFLADPFESSAYRQETANRREEFRRRYAAGRQEQAVARSVAEAEIAKEVQARADEPWWNDREAVQQMHAEGRSNWSYSDWDRFNLARAAAKENRRISQQKAALEADELRRSNALEAQRRRNKNADRQPDQDRKRRSGASPKTSAIQRAWEAERRRNMGGGRF